MKYLRKFLENKFQENIDSLLIEINKFCKDNLVYLIDEGFEVKVEYSTGKSAFYIDIHKIQERLPRLQDVERKSSFYWREIKEDFIPFFEMLDIKYHLCPTPNLRWIPSYQIEDKDNLVVDIETPMYVYEHEHFFYDRKQITSGKITNKKIKRIIMYIRVK